MRLKYGTSDFDRTLVNLLDFTDWNYSRKLVIKSHLENKGPKNIVTVHRIIGCVSFFHASTKSVCGGCILEKKHYK